MYIFIAIIISVFINIVSYFIMKRSFEKKFSAQAVLASIKREVLSLINDIEVESDKNFTIFENKVETLQNILTKAEQVEKNLSKSLKKASSKKVEDSPVVVDLKRDKNNSQTGFNIESASYTYDNQNKYEQVLSNKQEDLFSNNDSSYSESLNAEPTHKEPPYKENPLIQEVNELSREGFNPEFIAERLSISISEVNLMLSMK